MARHGTLTAQQPYQKVTAVTPSDTTTYDPPLDAFVVGTDGNVVVVDGTGSEVTIAAVAGAIYPIAVTKIMAATGAGDIVGLNW